MTRKSEKVVRPPTQNSDSGSPAQHGLTGRQSETSLASNRRQLMCAEGIDSFGLPSAILGNLGMIGPGGGVVEGMDGEGEVGS